jgi:predicted protein tyrosine phosphatase
MELKISGLNEAKVLMLTDWPTKIISLVEEDLIFQGDHHLHVRFDDIAKPITGRVHPTEDHLRQILEFADSFTDDDRVLVHCHAGISRSTAVAIAVLIHHGWSYDAAYQHVENVRPILLPNKLIIKYVDERFALGGKLIELVETNDRFPNLYQLQMEDEE